MQKRPTKNRRGSIRGGLIKWIDRKAADRGVNLVLNEGVRFVHLYEGERLSEDYRAYQLLQGLAKSRTYDPGGSMADPRISPEVKNAISLAARINKVPEDVVTAIVLTESGGSRWAVRFEPNWKYFYFTRDFADKLHITELTERACQATSWGCMQIMGSVAREHGWQGPLVMLTELDLGLDFGCKKLKSLFEKYETEERVIAAYNAGSPRTTGGTMFVNQTYVDKVYGYLRELRALS